MARDTVIFASEFEGARLPMLQCPECDWSFAFAKDGVRSYIQHWKDNHTIEAIERLKDEETRAGQKGDG